MIRSYPAAGTLLVGRAMIPQLTVEMSHQGASAPAVVHGGGYRRAAIKAARRIVPGFVDRIPVAEGTVPEGTDFLILVGGREFADRFSPRELPAALVIPETRLLAGIDGPVSEYLVLDSAFVSVDGPVARGFYRRFAAAIGAGEAEIPWKPDVPRAFDYAIRTGAIAGEGALEELPSVLKDAGVERPLVLSDKGIAAAGLTVRLEKVLSDADYRIFDDIPQDSDSRAVERIADLYRSEGRDGLIAFGGGSVLDTGKGVMLALHPENRPLAEWAGSDRIPRLDIPLIAIPTTSGTGSEVTKAAVIADADRGRKSIYISANLQPDAAVLDGSLSSGLPPYLTAITGMDALTHAVEAFTCLGRNPLSDRMAWAATEKVRDSLLPLMDEPGNPGLRMGMTMAAFLAGQSFSNSMVGMVHTIGHSVGAVCHAAHGACMAVLLPWGLEFNRAFVSKRLAGLLPALVGPEAAAGRLKEEEAAAAFIARIREMNALLREKSGGRHPEALRHMTDRDGRPLVDKAHFERIARTALGDGSIVYNPRELRFGDIMDVLEAAY